MNKAFVAGIFVSLLVGLEVGYIISPPPLDISEFESQINYLQNQIAEKDTLISNLQDDIEGFELQINTIQGQIAEKDILITNLQGEIADLESQINELTSTPIQPPTSNATWSLVWEYKADYEIKKVSISSDGNYIAAVGDNWEGRRNDVLHLIKKDGELLWKKDFGD